MLRREAHIIKPNKKSRFPNKFLFFDTETNEKHLDDDEIELTLRLGVAAYVRRDKKSIKWREFRTSAAFWRFVFSLINKETKLYMIAHNVSFDFRVVKGFYYLKREKYKIKRLIYSPTMNIWEFYKKGKSICVLDNMNFFKSSLEILGKSVGLEKMTMPKNDDKKLAAYCRRDVEIMIKAWDIFLDYLIKNDLGTFSKTIAGQAFAAYRHKFMRHKIYVHNNKHATKLERAAYHGGRTECFYIGRNPDKNHYLLDVNSMYPYVMKYNEYPAKLVEIKKKPRKLPLDKCIIARCLIKTNEPVFPYKNKENLIFPLGEFEAYLTTREYLYALKNKMIKEIYEAGIYEKQNLFSDYVDFFYQAKNRYKQENNQAFYFISKLFLNSLYGKFGQRNLYYEKCEISGALKTFLEKQPDGVYYIDDETYRKIGDEYWVADKWVEGYDSFCAIAAHITADARMILWDLIKKAGRENVFYCDTDSVIVNEAGYNVLKLFISDELGGLSLKDKSNNLAIWGAKDYEFGGEKIIKGIKKNAEKISETQYLQTKFENFAGALRKGRIDKMVISKTEKILKREYKKGIVLPSGYVEPFKLARE